MPFHVRYRSLSSAQKSPGPTPSPVRAAHFPHSATSAAQASALSPAAASASVGGSSSRSSLGPSSAHQHVRSNSYHHDTSSLSTSYTTVARGIHEMLSPAAAYEASGGGEEAGYYTYHAASHDRNTDYEAGFGLGAATASADVTRCRMYDVVLEDGTSGELDGDGDAERYNHERRVAGPALLPWLGSVVIDQNGTVGAANGSSRTGTISSNADFPRSGSGSSITAVRSPATGEGAEHGGGKEYNWNKLQDRLMELLETERSYVKRIEILNSCYAIPLRQLSRDRDTAILPLYEAQRLFGNIGEIVGANKAFLQQLESLMQGGLKHALQGLGDAMYQHMMCCSCYNEYFANIEKAKHIEQTMSKKKTFKEYLEKVKSTTSGIGNVGVRELLMEPVQRIPRYTLMLNGLVKYMSQRDPQRIRLEEAVVLASRIASCEADDKTKRAAVLWSFSRSVEGFPAELISAHREFIDSVDVDDFPAESLIAALGPAALFSPGGVQMATRTLHVTLFLFDDRLAVVKRSTPTASGRQLVGLDDLSKLADQMKAYTEKHSGGNSSSAGGGSALLGYGSKKGELAFRGMIDLLDVQAYDLGGPDFQLSFFKMMSNVSGDRWANRPTRQYVVSETNGSAAVPARMQKTRFLENLWRAQALLKTRGHRSHARCEILPASFDSRDRSIVLPRQVIYWNIYTRRSWLQEQKKTAVVLHVVLNEADAAEALPLGPEEMPAHAAVRMEDLDLDDCFCYLRVHTREEGWAKRTERVSLTSLHAFMADVASTLPADKQDFRNTLSPDPSTPSTSKKGVVEGLENFGRNLLHAATPGSIRSSTDSEPYSTAGRRSKASSVSYGQSSMKTHSAAGTSATKATTSSRNKEGTPVKSKDIGTTKEKHGSASPSPRKLVKKGAMSSLGPGGPLSSSPSGTPTRIEILSPRPDDHIPTREGEKGAAQYTPRSSPRARHLSLPYDATQMPPHEPASPKRTPQALPAKRQPSPNLPSKLRGVPSCERSMSGSKRSAPLDATPTGKPPKRAAHSVDGCPSPVNVSPHPGILSPSPRVNAPPPPAAYASDSSPSGHHRWRQSLKRQQYRANERREAFAQMRQFLVGVEDKREHMSNKEFNGLSKDLNLQLLKWLADAEGDFDAEEQDLAVILHHGPGVPVAVTSEAELQALREEAAKVQPLRTRMMGLERKCELLTALEADGRLENTELHRAFNEELDHMYEDTQAPESHELAVLRKEIQRTKAERNEINMNLRRLRRDLELQASELETCKQILSDSGLL
ncbi:hypothetical protein K437DRAFT_259490 [Tilletiaria anomala UBC 951]|uniref:DH domain-containing protein n=1 Tax=Tilletiaria anomala (strain ATCC 24038 / CBS 436.72 / UBC 951) TaxID=1037660 RepID=A0A066VHY3_TILAU|nr:uncharacterized protein K437DRAFT_259490 [Tilletiaria anomala UBC 951]KDN38200.1 hypothetical protein K437DRAFT_259490 [Tilletiaria anomala UBC 951]